MARAQLQGGDRPLEQPSESSTCQPPTLMPLATVESGGEEEVAVVGGVVRESTQHQRTAEVMFKRSALTPISRTTGLDCESI